MGLPLQLRPDARWRRRAALRTGESAGFARRINRASELTEIHPAGTV
jgi:hypothetical protein